jgi:hypothetical protein
MAAMKVTRVDQYGVKHINVFITFALFIDEFVQVELI